jgi:hypothetical protein
LTRPAEAITLLEVAELVDGPVEAGVPKLVKGADPRIDRELQAACEEAAEMVRRNMGRSAWRGWPEVGRAAVRERGQ